MSYTSYVSLIPLLPLAGFVVLGLWGKKYLSKVSGILGTLILLSITVLSFITAYQYFFVDGKVNDVYQPYHCF
jgi:NADH-quinone oxidoreductase subunit L